MDSLSALISAQVRMMDEPISKQRAVREINRFVVQNYLVAAHIAALRILLRRHAEGLPRDPVNKLIEQTYQSATAHLLQAQGILAGPAGNAATTVPMEEVVPVNPLAETVAAEDIALATQPEVSEWSGWHTFRRRSALLDNDLQEIVAQTGAIESILRKAETA